MEQDNKIVLFQDKKIRKVWHNEEWWFSVIDVVGILTDATIPSRYWNDLKRRVSKESGNNDLYAKCVKLKLAGEDGKNYPSECANTEILLRIIMSIPSPKAEPFKQWLAQVGGERIQEMENPEIGFERLTAIYKAKGYSDEWIKNRLQSIETRKLLTDEWKQRGITEGVEYSILTALISKGTFGLTPSEHSQVKGLEKENLRDHMSPLELIFSALGEEVTRRLAIQDDAQGFNENRDMAVKGGSVAGDALKRTEQQTGLKVISSENYLGLKKEDDKKELPTNDPDAVG